LSGMREMALGVALVAAAAGDVRADPKPLWEAGIGLVGFSVPDYGGSDERQQHVLPMPYLVYRGRRVQADRDGVTFFGSRWLELDFSLDAAPAVAAGGNLARRGMPELLPTLEAGPSVNLILLASPRRAALLKLRLAGRAAIASDLLHWDWLGVTAAPELALQLCGDDAKLTATVGPLFSSEGVHDHVYQVAPDDADPNRAAYDARGGYGGLRAMLRGGWRAGPLWLGGFVRYDYLGGAVFADSPLLRSPHAFTIGTAMAFVFARSHRWAAHPASPDRK
jgi:MipA family protein